MFLEFSFEVEDNIYIKVTIYTEFRTPPRLRMNKNDLNFYKIGPADNHYL